MEVIQLNTDEYRYLLRDGGTLIVAPVRPLEVEPVVLRQLDYKELMSRPYPTVASGLCHAVEVSDEAFGVYLDDEPEGYFGVREGQIWYLSSEEVFQRAKGYFLLTASVFMDVWLDHYGKIYNWTLKENTRSLRWLRRENFKFDPQGDWVYFWKEKI